MRSTAASGMEDMKPSIASLADDDGTMEARFADLCKVWLSRVTFVCFMCCSLICCIIICNFPAFYL